MDAPAVTVHGWSQAVASLAVGRPVTLLSAPGAGLFAGPGWWHGLVSAARAAHPTVPCADILDCGDAPGAAMAALRLGLRCVVLDPRCPALPAVRGAAGALGAAVLTCRPDSLDLLHPTAADRLSRWLGADDLSPLLG